MDYSAPVHENEDPAASPWGTNTPGTSPQGNRTVYQGVIGEAAPPFPFTPQPSNGLGAAAVAGSDEFPHPGATALPQGDLEGAVSQQVSPSAPVIESQETPFESPAPERSLPPTEDVAPDVPVEGSPQLRRSTQPQFRLQAKITGLERTGKKDPILRFDVHTNLPRYRTTQYRDVRRLHSEFVKLAEHLISANPEALVPAVPPPLTSAGAGTDEDEARVKALMQRWFNYVCSNEVLMKDDEMVLFVESDFGYSPLVKRKQPATGVRRKILKQFAPPPDDTPELADARPTVKLFYLGTMDAGHKVDKLVKARRGLGLAESDYGVKLGRMHVQEPHPGLANAYKKLGRVVQAVGDYHAAQATAEATTIGDPFQHHSQDAFIVKETLTNRQILIREFLQAQEVTRSKLNSADRLKASSSVRREKVDEAIAALDEARENELQLYNKTTRVTHNLVQERRRWFDRTAADLRMEIREFVLREIEAERRTLALLESVRADIRSIDGSGGLSRLGREAHPAGRRTSLAASQGPKGDAWSGAPRRSDAAIRTVSGSLVAKVPEEAEGEEGQDSSSLMSGAAGSGAAAAAAAAAAAGAAGLAGLDEDDEDRVDARNAASRLATSTF